MLIVRQIAKLYFMVNFFGNHRKYGNKKNAKLYFINLFCNDIL